MAGMMCVANAPLTATSTSLKTIVEVKAPSATDLIVNGIAVSFDGVTATDVPITVELVTTDGDGTGTSLTPVNEDRRAANTCAATAKYSFSAESASPVVLGRWKIHPQGGALIRDFGHGELVILRAKAVAIRVTAGVSINAAASIRFEE